MSGIFGFLVKKQAQDDSHESSMVRQYSERLTAVEGRYDECMQKHEECFRQYAEVREEIGRLKERLDSDSDADS